jgi:D-alanyl-D-alanine carboxypeptidase (penicillin-binding protein 5/6)
MRRGTVRSLPALSVLLALLLFIPRPLGAVPSPPSIAGSAAVLLDAGTGRLLYGLAAHVRRPPASTTKMMTALLVAEALTPNSVVPISPRAAAERSGSAIGLEAGERWTAGDLMRALLMHSANDTAIALAEGVAGSVEAFAAQMNARASTLGVRDTHFVTPHGRYDPQHYSSALDLALIARAALANPWIAEVVRSQTWPLRRGKGRLLINTNKLLWRYPGADGVKTGWIAESGPTLVASATRGGWQLIAVVLNSQQVFSDAAALLTYGFAGFERVRVGSAGDTVQTVAVQGSGQALRAVLAGDARVVIRRGAAVQSRVQIDRTTAPIEAGETVGAIFYMSEGTAVGQMPLLAAEGVPALSGLGRLWQRLRALIGAP